jgi:hypothetical protein
MVALVALATLGLAGAACCRKPPQSIVEVNLALDRAKEACATVYASAELAGLEARIGEMNLLADRGNCGRARKASEPVLPEVLALSAEVDARKGRALAEAREALASADAAVDRAREAEGSAGVSPDLSAALRSLDEARRMSVDPCAFPQAASLARGAAKDADRARAAALARSPGSGEPEKTDGRP